jgi:hypothetical protein
MGLFSSKTVTFKDGGLSHRHFWEIYVRPPKEEYWDYIVDRRDLLVPQDIRERKGSFFTPQIWVQKSQEYLTMVFGENWQEEYYVWDCAAGTGNLLVGLTNKYNIWASTLDRQDVDVIHDRIKNGAHLLDSHVFQFDFLNDSFDKLPQGLKEIMDDPEKRKKLIMYINPPYAESGAGIGSGINKHKVVTEHKSHNFFLQTLSKASHELFSQFMAKTFYFIPNAHLATFSTLKYLNSYNFQQFRDFFKATFKKGFICKGNTFDNVDGEFPIGFLIWELNNKKDFPLKIKLDICNVNGKKGGTKNFYNGQKYINTWFRHTIDEVKNEIAVLHSKGIDFQNNQGVWLCINQTRGGGSHFSVTKNNLIETGIYLSIRHIFQHTWINHNDQFLFPNDRWENDSEFQHDCLTYALLADKNRISVNDGVNHWIPFTAEEVNAKDNFKSNFMSNYIKDKKFSKEAKSVLKVGKELWSYYHSKIANDHAASIDASFYDIREYFQGRSESGTMKQKSTDEQYNALIKTLRQNLSALAEKIKPKVYEYGFLLE